MNDSVIAAPQELAAASSPSSGRYAIEIMDNVAEGWDALAAQFSDICLEQTASYMLGRWSGGRVCGLVLREPASGEPEALALAVVAAIPLVRAGLAYVKFGPLWRRSDRPARPAVLDAALRAAQQEFAERRGLVLRVMPPADPEFGEDWKHSLAEADFRLNDAPTHPECFLVNLTLSEAEQLASLGKGWRANLRKASPDVSVEEVDPAQGLPQFLALYGAMTERKGFVDRHRVEQLPAFVAAAPSSLRVRMFLAHAGGQAVAGSLIAGSGDQVFVPFSASARDALPLRAGYTLRWALINALRGSGAKWLDLGGDEGDEGLRHFKTGNVGSRGCTPSIPGEFDHVTSPLSAVATRGIEWAHRASARLREAIARR
jgi:hypothetical protein